jgi:hypothetical protein
MGRAKARPMRPDFSWKIRKLGVFSKPRMVKCHVPKLAEENSEAGTEGTKHRFQVPCPCWLGSIHPLVAALWAELGWEGSVQRRRPRGVTN